MTCPACGHENLPGADECAHCLISLHDEEAPQTAPARWHVTVDPIASLDPSTIEVQVVASGTPLADGIRRMQERNVGYLLVVDERQRLVGIITERDLVRKVAGILTDASGYTVDQFMTRQPTTLKASEPIKHALHFMALEHFLYIPLVDDEGRPEGLISFRRVARLLEQMD